MARRIAAFTLALLASLVVTGALVDRSFALAQDELDLEDLIVDEQDHRSFPPCVVMPDHITIYLSTDNRSYGGGQLCTGEDPPTIVGHEFGSPQILARINRYDAVPGAVQEFADFSARYATLGDAQVGELGKSGRVTFSSTDQSVVIFQRGTWFVLVDGTATPASRLLEVAREIDAAIIAYDAPLPEPPEPPAPPREPDRCQANGHVLDGEGLPLAGVRVRLMRDGVRQQAVATNTSGVFDFDPFPIEAPAGDSAEQEPQISFELELVEHEAERFEVHHGDTNLVAILQLGPIAMSALDESCRFDFNLGALAGAATSIGGTNSLDPWSAMGRIFRETQQALNYAAAELDVTVNPDNPLNIVAFCTSATLGAGISCPNPATGSWTGPTYQGSLSRTPHIWLGAQASANPVDGPINTVYHEVGHHVLMEGFSRALPYKAATANVNHGGLYANTSSNDAMIEGFAEFFALQVNRSVNQPPGWWLYPTGSAPFNLELDYKAWDMAGEAEEFSFAGVLVDLVDSNSDYTPGSFPERVLTGGSLTIDVSGAQPTLSTQVVNDTTEPVLFLFEIELADGTTKRALSTPTVVAPDAQARLEQFVLPGSVASASDVVRVRVTGASGFDDDNVTAPVRAVWDAFRNGFLPTDDAYPHPLTVSEAYLSFTFAFGGDRDNNGIDDVDAIFISHGFFADVAGGASNRVFDADEAIGLSGYSLDDGRSNPAREAPQVPGALQADFAVSGPNGEPSWADVEVVFDAPSVHQSYRYASIPDDAGSISVAIPPPDSPATVRITARGDGLQPRLLDEIDATTFWGQVTNIDERTLVYRATLDAGPSVGESDALVSGGVIAILTALGAAGAAVVYSRRQARPTPQDGRLGPNADHGDSGPAGPDDEPSQIPAGGPVDSPWWNETKAGPKGQNLDPPYARDPHTRDPHTRDPDNKGPRDATAGEEPWWN